MAKRNAKKPGAHRTDGDSDLLDAAAPVGDYRHAAKRKNNPPAKIAAEGTVPAIPRAQYAYNPHLPPVLRFDQSGGPDALPKLLAEAGRRPLTTDEQRTLADALRRQDPWLEWTGKREAKSFEVDPVALHIHERISTQAILKVAARQDVQRSLFADPQQEYHEAVQFYRHDVDWANRLILGDSLAVMSSLARREDLAGKVQMIYLDPPYGIKFASNFQPEVGRRDVKDKEQDLTREPEMVRAYRDTWHLGIHSYLSYLRDRLIVARELLADTGSIFVQISDENLHRVRTVLDEVFSASNFCGVINFVKNSGATDELLSSPSDYLLWYARDKERVKYRRLFHDKSAGTEYAERYQDVIERSGFVRRLSTDEVDRPETLSADATIFTLQPAVSQGFRATTSVPFSMDGFVCDIGKQRNWKTSIIGMERLAKADRLSGSEKMIYYRRFLSDFPAYAITTLWNDTQDRFAKQYVVQTVPKVVARCMLMTTDPGDLVLDPTCGSGTTAYVAEQWGRRWITIDTSRVAIAIARQRLLTAKFDHYKTRHGAGADSAAGRPDASTEPSAASLRRDVSSTERSAAGTERSADVGRRSASGLERGKNVGSRDENGPERSAGGQKSGGAGAQNRAADPLRPDNPALGFHYKTVPHITLKSIAQNTALDPIFARHEPRLTAALERANAALAGVTPEIRAKLTAKLVRKEREEGKRAVSDADRRRWELPRATAVSAVASGGKKSTAHRACYYPHLFPVNSPPVGFGPACSARMLRLRGAA